MSEYQITAFGAPTPHKPTVVGDRTILASFDVQIGPVLLGGCALTVRDRDDSRNFSIWLPARTIKIVPELRKAIRDRARAMHYALEGLPVDPALQARSILK